MYSTWRRQWQPTPGFLLGESHGQESLAGYSPGVAKSQTWLKWLSTHICSPLAFIKHWACSPLCVLYSWSLSHVRLFVMPWTVACQAPLSMGILQTRITGVGCHALLQGIFPTQGSNSGLPHCRWILYHLSHQGSGPLAFIKYVVRFW